MKLDQVLTTRINKTIYRDGDTVIKLFNEDFPKSDVLNEALNQARVEETGLNIPKIREVTKIDGKWAISMDYIEGKTLAAIMEEDPDHLDKYMDQFIDLQLEIQRRKSPSLNNLRDKMQRKVSALADFGIPATTRYDLHTRIDGMPKHSKVCHGDFNPSNIVITADGTPYIIDWSHATQGNGGADAARTYLLFFLKDEKLAHLYLDTYCEKNDTAKQYIQRWLPIVAASQYTKGNPAEQEKLRSWFDIMDYE